MIYVLPIFKASPYSGFCVDTTSNVGQFRELSPFILPAPPARNLENLWQFSKVYSCHVDSHGGPTEMWGRWRTQGWTDPQARRYPMGKGARPLYSFWHGRHLDYIEARKQIYAPQYAKNAVLTEAFNTLSRFYEDGDIILLDYDAYDHRKLGMTLVDVINEPKRKMGHAFVLAMILEGVLDECLV